MTADGAQQVMLREVALQQPRVRVYVHVYVCVYTYVCACAHRTDTATIRGNDVLSFFFGGAAEATTAALCPAPALTRGGRRPC